MIPLVATPTELALARSEALAVVAAVAEENGARLEIPVGTMIELPRAALVAGEIASVADFFSFGTNDLAQTTWGLSRNDAEGELLRRLPAAEHLRHLAVRDHRPSRCRRADQDRSHPRPRVVQPSLEAGICGEHGGNPRSIHFFDEAGLDYVPSPRTASP